METGLSLLSLDCEETTDLPVGYAAGDSSVAFRPALILKTSALTVLQSTSAMDIFGAAEVGDLERLRALVEEDAALVH
eukprot:13239-Eustigmatos_ZCMA.PRE.1